MIPASLPSSAMTILVRFALARVYCSRQLGIRDDKWHEVTISWDLTKKNAPARIQVDGKKRNLRLDLKRPTLHGISYAHFMACPAEENPGIYVEWVKASK